MASLLSIILTAHIYQIEAIRVPQDCVDLENGEDKQILQQEAFQIKYFGRTLLNLDKNGSLTFQCCKNNVDLITTDQRKPIHSQGLYLWFLPASLTDFGTYSCALWNTTYCVMEVNHVNVFQLPQNKCFHSNVLEPLWITSPGSTHIPCPEIEDYFQQFSVLQWFKNCNPITVDNKKYDKNGNQLLIRDANAEDNGMYTCKLEYEHLGKRYNVTRTTELKIKAIDVIQPELRNPKNNTIEARLGSELIVSCEAFLGFGELQISVLIWKVNNIEVRNDGFRIKQGIQINKTEVHHATVILRTLIISKIIEEDFQTTFECFAINYRGHCSSFFRIAPQSPDWTPHVIKIFVPLICVILACIIMYMIFKVDIVLWFREVFESHQPINDGKMFDAYVIFPRSKSKGSLDNCNTNHFVLHILPRILEEKCGYKLFIYGRDELPGQAAVEVIETNIRNSRRLIIILVQKSSTDDHAYSGFERQVGLFEALIQNKIKVILIELEKFDCLNDFPESIRHIIQIKGTIKWKPGKRNELERSSSRFWKQVRYKMPVRSKSSTSTVYDSQHATGAV